MIRKLVIIMLPLVLILSWIVLRYSHPNTTYLHRVDSTTIEYDQLPGAVKQKVRNFTDSLNLISDEKYLHTTGKDRIRSRLIVFPSTDLIIYGFVYEFHINERRYILNANKPLPIVYDKNNIYYPSKFYFDEIPDLFIRIALDPS